MNNFLKNQIIIVLYYVLCSTLFFIIKIFLFLKFLFYTLPSLTYPKDPTGSKADTASARPLPFTLSLLAQHFQLCGSGKLKWEDWFTHTLPHLFHLKCRVWKGRWMCWAGKVVMASIGGKDSVKIKPFIFYFLILRFIMGLSSILTS